MRYVLMAIGCAAGACGAAVFAQERADADAMQQAILAEMAAGASGSAAPASSDARPQNHPAEWSVLEKYCFECHNAIDWAGGVAFDTMLPDDVPADAQVWEEAVRKLRGRLMPPPDQPQPEQQAIDALVAWLENRLDSAAQDHPNPGHVVLHRLNRTEYAREIENLLGLRIDAAALLPKDTESEGFDNVANVLKVSPSFLDQYITAALDVSMQAVAPGVPGPASSVYRPKGVIQNVHIDGLPLGTRGGMLVEHHFPADGEYTFNIRVSWGAGYIFGMESRHRVIMTIDGQRVFEGELGGDEDWKALDQGEAEATKEIRGRFQNITLPVKAGPHRIGVTFVAKSFAEAHDTLQPLDPASEMGAMPTIGGLEIVGPFNPVGVSETPSRRKIFICRPQSEAEELPCARKILANIARKAFRRPVTDADLAAPMRFYEQGREAGGFEKGIQQGLMAILSSPKFLYRVERMPQDAKPGSVYQISDLELAARLSFFLWSQGPDDELLELAAANRLREPGVLEQQVRRMLADPRSESLVTNFAYQWLDVDEIEGIDPDPALFPEFDEALRTAFRREMELFVNSILREEDRSVIDLLTADHTFVNERLAIHYGIPNVRGDRFRRVKLENSARYGLLGKGAILMGTSYANRTAPVLRGAYILERILGTPPSAPPPGVEALKENMEGKKARTIRELTELHRADPACNSCHGIMDPLGFALENFDAVGKWRDRDRDAGTPIDAGGELHGIPINGPDDLRRLLVSRPEQFARTVTEKLLTYALGRTLEYHDMPTVRAIVREAAKDDYRFSSLVIGVVKSMPFQMKMVPVGDEPAPGEPEKKKDSPPGERIARNVTDSQQG